jgi:hypothetical protein
MITTFRAAIKVYIAVAAFASCLSTHPSYAGSNTVAYMSSTGSGSACTAAQPCASLVVALESLSNNTGRVVCLNGPASGPENILFFPTMLDVQIDCPEGVEQLNGNFGLSGAGVKTLRVRNMTFVGAAGSGQFLILQTGGTIILENCFFDDLPNAAIDIEPAAPLNLVIKNSRMSNSGSGILLKPGTGGSIKATLDHVTITNNSGGGIKTDSTNGVVNLDFSDGEISNNGGNGINAVAGANQNIVAIKNSVIARNGAAGVQANGVNAGVLISTTLLDQNAAGATSVVGRQYVHIRQQRRCRFDRLRLHRYGDAALITIRMLRASPCGSGRARKAQWSLLALSVI